MSATRLSSPKSESHRALLCVDLDGTLVATDTLDECLLCLLRHRPLLLFLLPFWLLGGKAHFKERVAAAVFNDEARMANDEGSQPSAVGDRQDGLADSREPIADGRIRHSSFVIRHSPPPKFGPLPYRPEVLEYIDKRGDDVDEVVLATAANWRIAQHVAQQCEFVTHVLASDAETNLSGPTKLAAIRRYAGERPFDYIGDRAADLPIWQAARQAIVVSGSNRLPRRIDGASGVTQISPGTTATAGDWLRQLRVHRWSKNLLLVLPLILAHKVTSLPAAAACLVAVIAFSLCASAVYIINDLIDLPHDREHPTMSNRPLARGAITIRQAVAAAGGLAGAALLLSVAFLPSAFLAMLVGYGAMSLAYGVWLKRVAVLDLLLLAGFYVYRVLIGAVAISVPVSFWLLAFAMFFFLALVIVKRYVGAVGLAIIVAGVTALAVAAPRHYVAIKTLPENRDCFSA